MPQTTLRPTERLTEYARQKLREWDPSLDSAQRYAEIMKNPSQHPDKMFLLSAAFLAAAMRIARELFSKKLFQMTELQKKQRAMVQQEVAATAEKKEQAKQRYIQIEEAKIQAQHQKQAELLREEFSAPDPDLVPNPELIAQQSELSQRTAEKNKELSKHRKDASDKMEKLEKNVDALVAQKQSMAEIDQGIEKRANEIHELKEKRLSNFEEGYGCKLSPDEKAFLNTGEASPAFLEKYQAAGPDMMNKQANAYNLLKAQYPDGPDEAYNQFHNLQLQRMAIVLAGKDLEPAATNKDTDAFDQAIKAEYDHRKAIDASLDQRDVHAGEAQTLIAQNNQYKQELDQLYEKMVECEEEIKKLEVQQQELQQQLRSAPTSTPTARSTYTPTPTPSSQSTQSKIDEEEEEEVPLERKYKDKSKKEESKDDSKKTIEEEVSSNDEDSLSNDAEFSDSKLDTDSDSKSDSKSQSSLDSDSTSADSNSDFESEDINSDTATSSDANSNFESEDINSDSGTAAMANALNTFKANQEDLSKIEEPSQYTSLSATMSGDQQNLNSFQEQTSDSSKSNSSIRPSANPGSRH